MVPRKSNHNKAAVPGRKTAADIGGNHTASLGAAGENYTRKIIL
ncbi:hypothetical protein HMPREF0083_05241 [Aneurinibacillus aneurinilyticus ATCC 12856]|uniref:Uncharacterized protein n=1 Tax=Aneurinibacillus aneurinilyticus ATCC 12856 TaxID=649747 RepID=U1Y348_ANEAE|nr:hypothetical protein HMPREF0083_05241 [Aneurinibacillus aneurinilyticus ATCC 12856]